jgi:hypothetical protein
MATFKQVLAVKTQFFRHVQGRYTVGKALQEAHDHTVAVMGTLPEGSGERVVDKFVNTLICRKLISNRTHKQQTK